MRRQVREEVEVEEVEKAELVVIEAVMLVQKQDLQLVLRKNLCSCRRRSMNTRVM